MATATSARPVIVPELVVPQAPSAPEVPAVAPPVTQASPPDVYWGDWLFVRLAVFCVLFMWGIAVVNLALHAWDALRATGN